MFKNVIHRALQLYDEIDWIIIVNREGTIEYSTMCNPQSGEFVSEHTSGMHILQVYPELKEQDSSLLRVLKTGIPILYERQTLCDFRGVTHRLLNSTVPILENGEVIGAIEVSKFLDSEQSSKSIKKVQGYSLEDIRTVSPVMLKLKEKILRIAPTDSSVLIWGETGTGKELVAQSIFQHSGRNQGSFVSINCASIPENLLESVLFGTAKGAYTNAVERNGLVQKADKGVLFLDELQMLPLNLQAKLLRFLEERTFRRLGETEEISVDVRVVSAMNMDPLRAIEQNLLREDLFYRLGVVMIKIPPLRERPEDIPVLTEHFIEMNRQQFNRAVEGVSELVMNVFLQYRWKGNVRELRHVIEGAFNILTSNRITLRDLPEYLLDVRESLVNTDVETDNEDAGIDQKVKEYEQRLIRTALDSSKTDSEAARKLKISRQKLRYKLEKYGMKN